MTDLDQARDRLREAIAEELYYEQHPEGRHRSEWPAAVYPDTVHEYRDLAAAVLPIVEAEVRASKAEAWDEACQAFAWCRDNGPIEDALPYVAEHNPYRQE